MKLFHSLHAQGRKSTLLAIKQSARTFTPLAIAVLLCTITSSIFAAADSTPAPLTLDWSKNTLTISGEHLPGKVMQIHYLEAYCRAGSTDADWVKHTMVGHTTKLLSKNKSGTQLKLRCTVSDGVTVDHIITSTHDEVDFKLTAHNPTDKKSEAHWAQPCIRVGRFAGSGADATDDKYAYIKKSFIFLDGKLTTMPTPRWALKARYIPGQVWAGPGVPRNDVNPRPLHPDVPSNGLIGCYSGDNKMIFATAFDPYQELFQGVIRCLHSDFRLGGLKPKETLAINGKIYILKNDIPALLARYEKDFPKSTALITPDLSAWQGIGATAKNKPAKDRPAKDTPAKDGLMKAWSVKDGVLTCDGSRGKDHAKWIATKETYDNFDLTLEFNVAKDSNSGVFIRAPLNGNPATNGMEVQLFDNDSPKYKVKPVLVHTGAIWNIAAPSKDMHKKAGQWQTMRIVCAGTHCMVWHNDERIVSVNLKDHYATHAKKIPGIKRTAGHIGLQNHGAPFHFRNVRIKKIKDVNAFIKTLTTKD
jgi:hypothetical protein